MLPALIGLAPGGLTFTLNPNAVNDIGLDVLPVPALLFTVIWIVIYACMGAAIWTLLRTQHKSNACIPIAVLIAGYLQTHLFWLTDSLRTTAITDATGFLLAATCTWIVSQYARKAALWLFPWLIWMPITLTIKIMALNGAFAPMAQ